jgi:hypothetical protein
MVATLADWAHPHITIYLFGSRVRGDHRPDSDVDVVIVEDESSYELMVWWTRENGNLFADIDAKMPGTLCFERSDGAVGRKVIEAGKQPVYVDRNVVCVWLPPKLGGQAKPR